MSSAASRSIAPASHATPERRSGPRLSPWRTLRSSGATRRSRERARRPGLIAARFIVLRSGSNGMTLPPSSPAGGSERDRSWASARSNESSPSSAAADASSARRSSAWSRRPGRSRRAPPSRHDRAGDRLAQPVAFLAHRLELGPHRGELVARRVQIAGGGVGVAARGAQRRLQALRLGGGLAQAGELLVEARVAALLGRLGILEVLPEAIALRGHLGEVRLERAHPLGQVLEALLGALRAVLGEHGAVDHLGRDRRRLGRDVAHGRRRHARQRRGQADLGAPDGQQEPVRADAGERGRQVERGVEGRRVARTAAARAPGRRGAARRRRRRGSAARPTARRARSRGR